MSKYTIELRSTSSDEWRQYGEYPTYLSAWLTRTHQLFCFYLTRIIEGRYTHLETRIVKIEERK